MTGVLLAGQALLFVAVAALARIVVAERRSRLEMVAALAALEIRIGGAETSAERLALFERRLEATAPIASLRRRWDQGRQPDDEALAAALAAIEKARILFPGDLADEMEEASALLTTCLAHLQWESSADGEARRDAPAEMADRSARLRSRLRDTIESLHARMSEASRVLE